MNIGNFSRDELYAINIHDLRKMGQQVGVKSPSSLNKEQLIENIYSIITGTKMPYKQKDKRGRPSKATLNEKMFADLKSITTFGSGESLFGFSGVASQGPDPYLTEGEKHKNVKRGTFIVNKNVAKVCKFPYVESKDDAFVSADLIEDYDLHNFDIVDYCLVNDGAMFKEVSFITAVNNRPISSKEIMFNRLNKCGISKKQLQVDLPHKIYVGGRYLVFKNSNFKNTTSGDELVLSLDNGKYKIIRICLDKQNIAEIKSENILTFSSLVVDNPKVGIDACFDALLEAKVLAAEGENVAIVVDNLQALIKAFKASYADNATMFIKRFLFSTNTFSNNSSITMLCLAQKEGTANNAISEYVEYFDDIIE